ncbi:MAG: LacI family DNA-binding transcriptional regulator [Acidobacteriota bacterium]|nr:LacI family DNA-binding transcriptional regulator [Acidobacteriota bacterium]MDE3191216.1 LacI family DNA-binding transcriptional regulator [Acidobacteriota bacterium]
MSPRPTIVDVAERSGASKSTVSYVIRGGAHVSPDLRRRVLAAVEELGYRPNGLARQLVLRRTSTIGVVVGDLANPFYGELVKRLERHAHEAGYATSVSNTDGHPEREAARVEALLEQRVAGIVMLQFGGDREILDEVIADGTPVAVVSSTEPRVDSVGVDERVGLALAVRHLAGLGHERIAYVTSPLVEERTNTIRYESFARACRETGCVETPLDEATAVAAANDILAIELVDRLEHAGRRVPADVSVVGFDGIAVGGLARIGLTTVAQPHEELASAGIRLLLDRVAGGLEGPPRRILLEPRLLVRATTARKER